MTEAHRLIGAGGRTVALLLLAGIALGTSACSWLPGLEDPEIRLEPRMYLYKPGGEAQMNSAVDGRSTEVMPLSDFGMNGRDEDYGGLVSVGDGFSGLDFAFQEVEVDDTSTGFLSDDFGAIEGTQSTGEATSTNSELSYSEFRGGYVAEVYSYRVEVDEDDELELRLGLGGELVHRDGEFEVRAVPTATVPEPIGFQKIDFNDDGVLYFKLRARAEWRNVGLQLDWAYSPDLVFGGEFTGDMHDIEIFATYRLDPQDISLVAGFRWSDIPVEGVQGGLPFAADFDVQGFLVGLQVAF